MMILRRPFFWIILLIAAGFIYAPLHGNNVSLRSRRRLHLRPAARQQRFLA